jgi:hypothetical protein
MSHSLSSSDTKSSQSLAPFEFGKFQEYARQYLPLAVERAFETIIQQRFQSLEAELRSGLNVKDIIRTSLSELFKTCRGREQNLNRQNSRARSEEDVPTTVGGGMNNFAQPLPGLPCSELSGSLMPSDDTLAEGPRHNKCSRYIGPRVSMYLRQHMVV